jgi:hypothetical protein
MGYRALLKNYIRHLVRVAGDHYIGADAGDGPLTRRDLAELRLLAAEVEREDDRPGQREAVSPARDSAARTRR